MNFEKIKAAHKLNKLDAVKFEKNRREVRKRDMNKRSVRKQKREFMEWEMDE